MSVLKDASEPAVEIATNLTEALHFGHFDSVVKFKNSIRMRHIHMALSYPDVEIFKFVVTNVKSSQRLDYIGWNVLLRFAIINNKMKQAHFLQLEEPQQVFYLTNAHLQLPCRQFVRSLSLPNIFQALVADKRNCRCIDTPNLLTRYNRATLRCCGLGVLYVKKREEKRAQINLLQEDTLLLSLFFSNRLPTLLIEHLYNMVGEPFSNLMTSFLVQMILEKSKSN